ncbi:protein translocase subunit SecF [Klenkia terrae]|uniref:Protein-export membrane protein SecF n=1 Tax=Klenkia terrae TaxID=1052259 RepID=A0ABU8E2N5_9ACTN|nr:protein translocase subunit SecF [Klenkia terrae]SSC21597.1 protein-export membrane protein SecF [Klenkia terrae]
MTGTPRDGGSDPAEEPVDGPDVPVGTDADETPDESDADIREDAARDADDGALADAGLPTEGDTPADSAAVRTAPRKASLAHRLYNGEAGLDVVGRSRFWYKVTAVVVLVCVASMIFRGFNFGIDFEGGNSFRVPASTSQLADIREAAEEAGAQVSTAQIVGGNTVLLRTGTLDNAAEATVVSAIADAAGVTDAQVSPESVSADWGRDITDQALIALLVFLAAVVVFLAIRFQPKMAVGAIVALAHDIILTAGVYSIVGFEVTPSTVIGFLTILGFSLYDTVVVFDKVDENVKDLEKGARMTWGEAANLAVNQTLMRSINTSVIALLPVLGLLVVGVVVLGVGTLQDLALVLTVGLAAGTYSSIFLATPVLADLKAREPGVQALRKRVLARRAADARAAGGATAAGPVASARRARPARSATALVDRDELPERPESFEQVESPASVTRTATAPKPGARPQRPGGGKKRR